MEKIKNRDGENRDCGLGGEDLQNLCQIQYFEKRKANMIDNNFEALLIKGYGLHNKGLLNEALRIYKKALQLNSNDERLHYYLGYLYDQKKEYPKSIKEYTQAIEINPKNYLSYNGLGLALQKVNRLYEAIESFKKAIGLNPNSHTPHFNLGRLYARNTEQFRESIGELKKSLELNPSHISSYYGLGYVYEKISNKKDAVEMYKKILEIKSDSRAAQEALEKLKGNENRG